MTGRTSALLITHVALCNVMQCIIFRLNVKLHLESEEVVYGADDDVDGRCAARLCPQVVLEICRKEEILFKSSNARQS